MHSGSVSYSPLSWVYTIYHLHGIRLLARVLKEGVQFWYNEISTVKGGGGGQENVPLENL